MKMKHSFFICIVSAFILPIKSYSQNANPFNGSLQYGLPLLSVPSDRGNAVPISLSYGGNGISVEQPSSDVGLGWGLSAGGSIVRSVSGIPDDFNGNLFNQNNKQFSLQKGTLHGPTSMDILTSQRNLDSTQFYFPNYDSYNVSGPGIGGSMTPLILNYLAFKRDNQYNFTYDADNSGTWKTPQFIFNGDFSDTLVSRHYPTTPVNSSTPFKMPKDIISGACYNDATSYYGKKGTGTGGNCAENYDPTTNRLASSNFVEYTMGTYGIESFTITNSAGFVYIYNLPVYSNYSINYSYPLSNDYGVPRYTNSFNPDIKTGTNDNYFIEHQFSGGTYITEYKETNRVAKEWKLTAIKGPDYVDANSNQTIDDADKGYWVVFDYKLWSNNFTTRYPAYGYNQYFGLDSKTANFAMSDPYKRSGKLASVSLLNEELYYLNSIKTSTHKAILVRDLRMDEVGANPSADSGLQDSVKIDQSGTIASWHGNMFDDAGYGTDFAGSYKNYPVNNYIKTVQLGNVDKIVLNFKLFDLAKRSNGGSWLYDNLHIYAGPNDTYPEISFTYNSQNYSSPFNTPSSIPGTNIDVTITNYTATAITFKIEEFGLSTNYGTGNFNIEWHASGKKTPQLYVKRVLLFNNSYTLPSLSSISNSNTKFDLTSTTNTTAPLYNETWYQTNKTLLDINTLKGSVLEYDYSLANKYYRNINCDDYYKNTRLSSPSQVLQNLSVTTSTLGTGKLTLNKVISLELGGTQFLPSYKFDYNSTITNDNPDYNPMKTDYWGFYKSDVSSLGYYGYVTDVSKDYVDAWSLRKITQPYGGITEIEYESNSYNKVLKGTGGHRGPSRIYPISSLPVQTDGSININLEEGTNLSSDLAQVYSSSAQSNSITAEAFIPMNELPNAHNPINGVTLINYFGTMSYSYNPTTPLPIIPTSVAFTSEAQIESPIFKQCTNYNVAIYNNGYEYTGNGWVRFNFPTGMTVYGNGNRVKKIIERNNTKDAYTTLYEYEDGVALSEADRFTNPRYRYAKGASCSLPEKLEPAGSDKFDLAPDIGYSKVKIKNLGQVNASKGWNEMLFNTSDALNGETLEYIDNYKVNNSQKSTFTSTVIISGNTCSRVDTGSVVEFIDKFSPYWGLLIEDKAYDVNNHMLSRSVMEYENTEQGAMVENFTFGVNKGYFYWEPGWGTPGPCNQFEAEKTLYQTCIKRHYPVVLKKTTTYGMGSKTISETLRRDEITGEETSVRISSDNKSTANNIKVPAFRISAFANMGPKSINSAYANVLGAEAYHYAVIDSSLTGTGQSVNFAGAGANIYTKSALTRGYNISTNTYTNTTVTLPNWYNNKSYAWIGAQGSIDTYGLYKRSELTSNPFNFSNPTSSDIKWRMTGEISLMDDKGHTLETRSFNNKFSSNKLDFSGKYLIAQASNCNYKSFTFCGFELDNTTLGLGVNDGEINMPASYSSVIVPSGIGGFVPHTGKYVAQVLSGGMGPNYSVANEGTGSNGEELGLLRDRVYRASVWVYNSSSSGANLVMNLNGSIGGSATDQTVSMNINDAKAITIGNWKLLSIDIKVPYNYTSTGGSSNKLTAYLEVQGGGSAWFDDFQFHPVESGTSAKVFDLTNGRIVADLNTEGFATKYVYDAAGNLIDTYQEIPNVGLKLIKHKTFNYARGTN